MSAKTDYPPIPNGSNRPGGWGLLHKQMCEEIDHLRYERDALIARRDEVMRLSGKSHQQAIGKLTLAAELARRGLMQVQLDPYEYPDTQRVVWPKREPETIDAAFKFIAWVEKQAMT